MGLQLFPTVDQITGCLMIIFGFLVVSKAAVVAIVVAATDVVVALLSIVEL